METWILLSVAAAVFQTLRFMLQKHLSQGKLSTGGATFSRFFYSVPFITTLTIAYLFSQQSDFPDFSGMFWVSAFLGGLSQILATWFVVALFQQRNFAVGITFKKTEVLLTALAGFVILGDAITTSGFLAIFIGLIGVLVLSQKPDQTHGSLFAKVFNRGAGLGLLSGLFFAFSAVGYRAATLEIASDDVLLRSSVTLAVVTCGQTLGMLLWLYLREPGEISRVVAARRTAVWMGITGMAGSLCWFTAFTLQNAAYVFAVGQIEVIFSIAASALFFKESISRREYFGISFITLSIVYLVVVA